MLITKYLRVPSCCVWNLWLIQLFTSLFLVKNFSSCRENSVRLSTWNNNHLIINDSQLKVDSRNLHLELQNRLARPQNWGQQPRVEEIDHHFHKTRAWSHFVIVIKSIVYVSHICFAHVFLWGQSRVQIVILLNDSRLQIGILLVFCKIYGYNTVWISNPAGSKSKCENR